MTLPEDTSGIPPDHPDPDVATQAGDWKQRNDFDIDEFLGPEGRITDEDHLSGSGWRRKVSGPGVRGWFGDFAFTATTVALKRIIGPAIMVFIVVLLVFGPDAPWGQLTQSILSGGADEESTAQCEEVGEWFSLFDKHTNHIYGLMEDAGPPNTWSALTIAKIDKQLPIYMEDWLDEMSRSQPPPAGRRLNELYLPFLENFGKYVTAIKDGDRKAQKVYERENALLLDGIDIETRFIVSLCI